MGKRGNAPRRGHGRCEGVLIGLLAAALGASSVPAHAAAKLVVPDRHGVIHTCIGGNDNRELHVFNAGEHCPDHEKALPWNWRGRPGPRGKPGAEGQPFASLVIELVLADEAEEKHKTGGSRVKEAASTAGDWFTLLGLGILALALALSLARWVTGYPWRWGWLRRWRWVRSLGKLFGPALQIEAFEDGAMEARVGPSFALLAQARIAGGRETGSHLYLVTGEERTGDYIAALQGVPQTQVLALALSLLRLLWRRPRLTVSGSLKPITADQTAAVTVSLRLDAQLIDTSEFWLSEPPTPTLTAAASNRVLAVAVAGWIEHKTIDETPGPPASEVLLSSDSRSWALFRAGSELVRMSLLDEAANLYERALAIDRDNVGALIDLAHLRRREGHYEGARVLAADAIGLIRARNRQYGRRDDEDANWYRAQIVLATTYSDWARVSTEQSDARDDACKPALRCAIGVATSAMATKDRLERLVRPEDLRAAPAAGKIGAWRYAEAIANALARCLRQALAGNVQVSSGALRRLRTFRRTAVELHALLETTFEPGALLLVASNIPTPKGKTALPRRSSDWDCDGESLEERRERLAKERKALRTRLTADPPDVRPSDLIKYVRDLPFKSARVVYNLACWSEREAARENVPHPNRARDYRYEAFELLRQSISRTPPLERRALLSYAEIDEDLRGLRRTYGAEIARLWRLVPTDEARFREFDQFTRDAIRLAKRRKRVRGLAVVGSWALGDERADAVVEVVLVADVPAEFINSDSWLDAFGRRTVLRRRQTQATYRLRIELPSGLAVEFMITASVTEARATDPDLWKLASEGFSVLYDEGDVLRGLVEQAAETT